MMLALSTIDKFEVNLLNEPIDPRLMTTLATSYCNLFWFSYSGRPGERHNRLLELRRTGLLKLLKSLIENFMLPVPTVPLISEMKSSTIFDVSNSDIMVSSYLLALNSLTYFDFCLM